MKYPYCLPIIKTTKQNVIDTINRSKDDYQYFEVWLDHLDDCDEAFVKKLANDLKERLILVFRRLHLEPAEMSFEQQKKLFDSLKNTSVKIDLDISQHIQLDYLHQKEHNAPTIISYHNYERTPKDKTLLDILQQIRSNNPTIIKFATMCQNEQDAVRLLAVLVSLKKLKQKFVVLGMGEHGLITRIFGTLWGNELVFAPQDASESSALGQLTKKQMDGILKLLENK